jgi:hypothetical protein
MPKGRPRKQQQESVLLDNAFADIGKENEGGNS